MANIYDGPRSNRSMLKKFLANKGVVNQDADKLVCNVRLVLALAKLGQVFFVTSFRFPLNEAYCSTRCVTIRALTLSLLISYIYGVPCKTRNFNVIYIYGLTFGNAENRLFLFAAQCFNIESMQKVILCHSCVQTLCQLPRLP
jgi:hypothetical protein